MRDDTYTFIPIARAKPRLAALRLERASERALRLTLPVSVMTIIIEMIVAAVAAATAVLASERKREREEAQCLPGDGNGLADRSRRGSIDGNGLCHMRD